MRCIESVCHFLPARVFPPSPARVAVTRALRDSLAPGRTQRRRKRLTPPSTTAQRGTWKAAREAGNYSLRQPPFRGVVRAWDREVLGLGLRVSSLPSRFCCPARWGDDFEDWEKKPAVPEKKVLLQKLDDFDGLAPPPEPKKDEEPGASVCVCVCVCVCPVFSRTGVCPHACRCRCLPAC